MEIEKETCSEMPGRKRAAGLALESSTLTATSMSAPSQRSSPNLGEEVIVRRSPRFCKKDEAAHPRSPCLLPCVKTEPPQCDEEEDDDAEDSHDDAGDSHDDAEDSRDDAEDSRDDAEDRRDDEEDRRDDEEDSRDDAEDSRDDAEDSHDDAEDSHDDMEDSHDDVEGGGSSDDDGNCETAPSRPSFLVPECRNYAAELSQGQLEGEAGLPWLGPAQMVPRTPYLPTLRPIPLEEARAAPTQLVPRTPYLPTLRPIPLEEARAAPVPPSWGFDFMSLVPPPEHNRGGNLFNSLFYGTERRLLGVQAPVNAPFPKRPADAEGRESKRPRHGALPWSVSGADTESHFAHREESLKNRFTNPSTVAAISRYPTASCCTTPSTITTSSCATPSSMTTASRYPTSSSFATPPFMTTASRHPTSSGGTIPEAAQQGGPKYRKTFIQRLTERDRRTGVVTVRQVQRETELDSDQREMGTATTILFRSREVPPSSGRGRGATTSKITSAASTEKQDGREWDD